MTTKETSRYLHQKEAYKSNNLKHRNHSFTFLHKIFHEVPLTSTASILSQRLNLMAYYTTASLEKLKSIDYVDFGKCQERFSRFSGF